MSPSNRLAQETTFERRHARHPAEIEVHYLCQACDEEFTLSTSSEDEPRFCPMCGRRARTESAVARSAEGG